jgi:formylglycine-generating enzyme
MERTMRRTVALLCALPLPLWWGGCSSTLPPRGQALIYLDTDAPLAPSPGTETAFDEPAPLFDGLRADVLDESGKIACADCVRDFSIDRESLQAGRLSIGVVPREGVPLRVRLRMFRRARMRGGEPPAASTVSVTFTLPALGAEGVSEWTAFLPTARLAMPDAAPVPLVPGRPSPHTPLGTQEARDCEGAPPREGMACAPGGTYWMDNALVAVDALGRDLPERAVLLRAFYVDAHEVTVGQFRASAVATGTDPVRGQGVAADCTYTDATGVNEGLPVTCVSWERAAAYCAAHGDRLPTSAELEYLAGGRRSRGYVWGDGAPACEDAVFARYRGPPSDPTESPASGCASLGVGPAPPGSGRRDRLPLVGGDVVDVAGNVAEWTNDAAEPAAATSARCRQPGFYEAPQCPARSAREDPLRVARGGSFALVSTKSVSGFVSNPATGDLRLGFRCAHDRR